MPWIRDVRFFYDGERLYEHVNAVIDEEGVRVGKSDDEEIDGRNAILLPSFLNAHAHLPMIAFRGMHEDLDFFPWLESVWKVERRWRWRFAYPLVLLSLAENVRNGSPEVVSMYWFFEETARAAEFLGVKVYTGPVFMRPFPTRIVSLFARRFLRRRSRHVEPMIFLHALYTLGEAELEKTKEFVEEGARLQIHAGETREDMKRVKERFGEYPLRVLHRYGLLHNISVVHGGWLTKDELTLLGKEKGELVHCPSSNMKLATHGFFPWREARDRGVRIRIGTDSQASNNAQDMFFEIRTALLLNKHNYWDAGVVGVKEVFEASRGNGWMLVDLSGLRFLPLDRKNVLANLAYNGHGDLVRYVFLHGKIVYPFEERVQRALERAKKELYKAFTHFYSD